MRDATEFEATVERVDYTAEELTLCCDGRCTRHFFLTSPAGLDLELEAGDEVVGLDFGDEVDLICCRLQESDGPFLVELGPPLPAWPR